MDVASERQRVLRGDADNDMVKIENLTKVGLGHGERGCLQCRGEVRVWAWSPCGDALKGDVGQVPDVALGQGRTPWDRVEGWMRPRGDGCGESLWAGAGPRVGMRFRVRCTSGTLLPL